MLPISGNAAFAGVRRRRAWLALFVTFQLTTAALWGQWLTQSVPLQAGWDAVYLPMQPVPAACDEEFAGLPVAQVQRYNQRARDG